MKNLLRSGAGDAIQGIATDPGKVLGTKAAATVYKVRPPVSDAAAIAAGTVVDITGWLALILYPVADGQIQYNGVAAKVEPIYSGQQNVCLVHPSVTQLVFSVDCIVCGM